MDRTRIRISLLAALLAGAAASSSRAGDEPRKELTVEAFRLAVKESRSVEDKADLLRALGSSEDAAAIPEISRFLAGNPADINYQLPLAAAAALANFRGNKAASLSLIQAVSCYKKNLFVQKRLLAALGQVGHESAVPALEDLIRGNDGDLAVLAVWTAADLPADLALDSLFRSCDWMTARRPKVGDDVKKLYDRIGGEILKVVQQISAEKYPSLPEMQHWWLKHGREWKDIAASRERNREAKKTPSAGEPAAGPIVELLFSEKGGMSTANLGSSSGMFPVAALTKTRPAWSGEAPPPGTGSSLDWGTEPGAFAVDVTGLQEHLKNLKSVTVTGWINVRNSSEGAGGNRIVSWLDRDGLEVVHRSDGSLQVGVNQKADDSGARTPSGLIPRLDEKVENALAGNWRFFAATYDSTAASAQLKIFVGTRDADAKLAVERDCPSGKLGGRIAPGLSVGNVPAGARQNGPRCNFRGLIDEVRIYGSVRDGSGALSLPAIIKIQART